MHLHAGGGPPSGPRPIAAAAPATLARQEGMALFAQGEYEKALAKFQEMLQAALDAPPGPDGQPTLADQALALHYMGMCLQSLRRPKEALEKFEAALAIIRTIFEGRDHSVVVWRLWNVGDCLSDLDRPGEALEKCQAALAMARRLHKGQDHIEVVRGLGKVADCLWALRRIGEALKEYQAALAMCRRLYNDQPNLPTSLHLRNVAFCLMSLGQAPQALPNYQAALEMNRRLHPNKDSSEVAMAMDDVASCLRLVGNHAEALTVFQSALAMWQRLVGDKDHPGVANALLGVADCLFKLGRTAEALPKYRAALDMWRRIVKGEAHPAVANCLSGLAACLLELGRPAEACREYQAVLVMWRRIHHGADHPAVATALNNLASSLKAMGQFGRALPTYEEALAMATRLAKGRAWPPHSDTAPAAVDDADIVTGLNNLAACLDSLGRSKDAQAKYEAALAMAKRLWGDRDHDFIATTLNNLAHSLKSQGLLDEALRKYQAALAMQQRLSAGKDTPAMATGLNNVASCLDDLSRHAEAMPMHTAALAMWRRIHQGADHPTIARTLNNLATCLRYRGRFREAQDSYNEALAIGQRTRMPDAFRFASNLGRLYLVNLGQPDKAAEAFDKAITGMEIARVALGGSDLDRTGYFAYIRQSGAFEGMIRAQLGLLPPRPDKALEYAERGRALGLRDVLERGRQLQGGDVLGAVEAAARQRGDDALLAEITQARQREADAHTRVNMLKAGISQVRGSPGLGEADRGREIRKLEAQLAEAQDAHQSARRVVFNLATRHVARNLKACTAEQIQALLGPKQRLAIYTISDEDGLLLLVGPAGRQVRSYQLAWPPAQQPATRGGTTAPAWISPGPVTRKTLDMAVEYYLSSMIREGHSVRGVRREAPVGPTAAERSVLGWRLFQALVPAALWEELKSVELLYVVPDGAMHRLPLETLVVGDPRRDASRRGPLSEPAAEGAAKDRRYWLDDGPPLVYGPSATVLVSCKDARDEQLARLAAGSLPKRLATLLGDPIFQRGTEGPRASQGPPPDDTRHSAPGTQPSAPDTRPSAPESPGAYLTRYGALVPLPGTRTEVLRIYRTLTGHEYRPDSPRRDLGPEDRVGPPAAVLLGEDATCTRLYAEAPGSRYLHLATHGLMDTSQNAIYSSLALTQPKVATPTDFGFLTLVDLFDRWWGRLGATELVVLSACDTQRGRIESGEGVFGISWGFLYAGSPAVVASLWQVADESTAELMAGLYGRIGSPDADSGPDHGPEARMARLAAFVEARKALRKKWPEPWFWAPFIYIGDPR